MQLDDSYEIFELTQHEGVVVSKARDKKTGNLIQIHLFPNEKIPEASQICARLLSLPEDARRKVLKYGQDGSSTYFITEPLPEGEGLAEWVRREAAPRPATRQPEVSSGAMGSLRRIDIEPAPLQPLPPGAESRLTPLNQTQPPNPRPSAPRAGPIVRPIPASTSPIEPAVREMGDFTRLYTREELKVPAQAPQPPQAAPSTPASPAPPPSSMGFTQIYGAQDWKMPEPATGPETAPEATNTTRGSGAGLETFIGIPKPSQPPAPSPKGVPLESSRPLPPPTAPARPAFAAPPMPSPERFSSPSRSRPAAAGASPFDAPPLQTSVQDRGELFSPPLTPVLPPPAPQSFARQAAATPQARGISEPLFSGKIAVAAVLGLIAVAAIVVILVEVLG